MVGRARERAGRWGCFAEGEIADGGTSSRLVGTISLETRSHSKIGAAK